MTNRAGLRVLRRVIAAMVTSVMLSLPATAVPEDAPQASPYADYKIGPGDKIHIGVYDEEGMTGDYLVSERGDISFPLIGDYHVGGKTVADVRKGIESRLARGLVNDPKVTAQILAFRPFYILGEVNKPGEYPYSMGLTVYRAVATAQGFTYRASRRTVLITHAGEAAEHKVKVSAGTIVLPGDTVRVVEKFF